LPLSEGQPQKSFQYFADSEPGTATTKFKIIPNVTAGAITIFKCSRHQALAFNPISGINLLDRKKELAS